MQFEFVVKVEVEHEGGKYATREEISERIIEVLEGADPQDIEHAGPDGGSTYTVEEWGASETTFLTSGKYGIPVSAVIVTATERQTYDAIYGLIGRTAAVKPHKGETEFGQIIEAEWLKRDGRGLVLLTESGRVQIPFDQISLLRLEA